MEKIVKGATKIKLAAPKSKYVEALLTATHGGEDGVAEVFRTLQIRLRDSTWTIVFKGLIVVHLMIREGQPDVTLKYIAESPKRLAISNFTEVQTQGANIRRYSDYLLERARGYRETKLDFVRVGAGRLKSLKVEKGLLREAEAVQHQIRTLLKCDILGDNDPENEISLTAFRLLTMDLLELFKVMNEGTINVLEHYFEMSRPDAERALNIYKTFGKQTDQVVQYLSVARQYEMSTRLEVPKLKHAPTTLTSSLEEYLNDPDFEINRRQYLIQQDAKKGNKPGASPATRSTPFEQAAKPSSSFPSRPAVNNTAQPPAQQPKGPAPDLIDFFESIEQNQQPMAQQSAPPQQFANGFAQAPQQYQQTGFSPQQSGYNPFAQAQGPSQFLQSQIQQQPQPIQQDFTGAGFGGYTPQSPQQQQQQQQQQQPQPYSFQPSLSSVPQNNISNFQPQSPTIQAGPQMHSPGLQPQQTSSNPFRQASVSGGSMTSNLPLPSTMPTRSATNPFAKRLPAQQPLQTQQQPDAFSFASVQTSSPTSTSYSSPPPPLQTQHQDLQPNPALFSPSSTQSPPPLQQQQLQPQRTGTNPFARNRSPPQQAGVGGQQQPFSPTAAPIMANPTGSTNPFRQGAFVNQQTGLGWQHSTQGTLSGFDVNNLETTPIFPRPGQA